MKKCCVVLIILFVTQVAFAQPKFVTTIYPFFDIVRSIVGDRGVVYNILPSGASPHTYQLRPSDMRHVETATAMIMGGPGLDDWAYKLPNTNRIELLDLVPDSLILTFEAFHEETRVKDSVSTDEHAHHHHEGDIDPHFWTDPLTVRGILPNLTEIL